MPPKKSSSLGRTLIKAHKRKGNYVAYEGFRHTSDLPDGRDCARLNLKSVTEQTSLDDFLDQAALAENDFNTELSNIKIVDPKKFTGILSKEERALVSAAQDESKDILCIPRRPFWDISLMTKEEIDANEREAFLIWRRKFAESQENSEHINLTPFEKNLEVWRQLWRVIERSDVIVQIIDARNPLLFQCPDLEKYAKEIDDKKLNILLLNKADLLTEDERKCWCEYYEKMGLQIVFFSALLEGQRPPEDEEISSIETVEEDCVEIKNSPEVLSREALITFFKRKSGSKKSDQHVPTIGLLGYPNVGKSSTLNALLMCKRACVSATPGKTKHFQTHIIDEDLCLCDCPGLVFPNFVSTKAEMVVNGILPIDELTEWNQPITLVCNMIPRDILQATYSILILSPGEGRDPNSPPTAEEFLNAHGYNRGFMTQRGLPDNSRSSRYILKDFVNGKLLFCHAPPGVIQSEFHKFPEVKSKKAAFKLSTADEGTRDDVKAFLSEADKKFFLRNQMHVKGKAAKEVPTGDTEKPWKKHHNRNKKEKLRRVYNSYSYE